MGKSTVKYQKFNSQVINSLSEKHKISVQFIRKSLRGESASRTSDLLCKEYKRLVKQVETALNN